MRRRGSGRLCQSPAASGTPRATAAKTGKRKATVESDDDKEGNPAWSESKCFIDLTTDEPVTTTDKPATATDKPASTASRRNWKREKTPVLLDPERFIMSIFSSPESPKSHHPNFAADADGESSPTPRQPVGRLPGSQSVPNLGNPDTFFQSTETCAGSTSHAQAQEQQQAQSTAQQHRDHAEHPQGPHSQNHPDATTVVSSHSPQLDARLKMSGSVNQSHTTPNSKAGAGDGVVYPGSSISNVGTESTTSVYYERMLNVERAIDQDAEQNLEHEREQERKLERRQQHQFERELEQHRERERVLKRKLEQQREREQEIEAQLEHERELGRQRERERHLKRELEEHGRRQQELEAQLKLEREQRAAADRKRKQRAAAEHKRKRERVEKLLLSNTEALEPAEPVTGLPQGKAEPKTEPKRRLTRLPEAVPFVAIQRDMLANSAARRLGKRFEDITPEEVEEERWYCKTPPPAPKTGAGSIKPAAPKVHKTSRPARVVNRPAHVWPLGIPDLREAGNGSAHADASGGPPSNGTPGMDTGNGTSSVSDDGTPSTAHSNITLPPPRITADLVPTEVPNDDDPTTAAIRSQRSWLLNYLTAAPRGRPTVAQALDERIFPFMDAAGSSPSRCDYGVVKIKNIPFKTTRSEIMAFLGRKSTLIADHLDPIHIIMERVTSKTMDAYAEFGTLEGAVAAVARHAEAQRKGRPSRLGDRPVEIEVSSQESLMADLFPLAKGIEWKNITPHLKERNPDEPWNDFKGFVSEEEMTMLVKHVEVPQRSPFSRECPQRPFECMISTLRKMPWHMTDWITLRQRHAIFRACYNLIKYLRSAQCSGRAESLLNQQLLNRLGHTAMGCPGFTMVQKDDIARLVNLDEYLRRMYGLPLRPSSWVHLYGLGAKLDMPLDVIEYYIAIIREETVKKVNSISYDKRARLVNLDQNVDKYFGYLWLELNLPHGEAFDNLTLGQVARHELYTIERILTRAFT